MAPKTTCNPAKLTSIVAYFHQSRVAHSIKDLEKCLPSIASINGMQVKDYLQTLCDDNRITVEKIGTGNWYWSFHSSVSREAISQNERAQAEHDKQLQIVSDLKEKLTQQAAARTSGTGEDAADEEAQREELMKKKAELEKQCKKYREDEEKGGEEEVERMKAELDGLKRKVEVLTDDVYSMEGWMKKVGAEEMLAGLKESVYGDQIDPETGVLRELE